MVVLIDINYSLGSVGDGFQALEDDFFALGIVAGAGLHGVGEVMV